MRMAGRHGLRGLGLADNVDQALFLVVVDVDTGGDCFVDEQANVGVEDVSGAAEDGQWASPVRSAASGLTRGSLMARVPRQCSMNTRVPSRPSHGSLG